MTEGLADADEAREMQLDIPPMTLQVEVVLNYAHH